MSRSARTADLVAAWATAVGVGSVIFMVGWLIGSRLFGALWAAPAGPITAMATAIVLGFAATVLTGIRLAHRVSQSF